MKWTNKDIDKLNQMIDEYKTYKEIAKELDRTKSSIHNYCYKNNLKTKRVNHNLFDKINHSNIWVLGFFTADGTTSRGKVLEFYNADLDLIKEVKKITKSINKITIYTDRSSSYGSKPIYKTQITSTKISNYLKSINGFGNKDERNPFKYIPDKYKYSFIKGYIDGDGSIYKKEIIVDGRKKLITDMYNWITKKLNIKRNKIYQHSCSNKTFEFRVAGKEAIKLAEAIKNKSGKFKSNKIKKMYRLIDS